MLSKTSTLRFDLHIHSRNSPDGVMSYGEICSKAEFLGLDGISITDHDWFNLELFKRWQKKTDLQLIAGEEISVGNHHVLAYFINQHIEPGSSLINTVEEIHSKDGMAVLAHPFRSVTSYSVEDLTEVDAIEFYNARSGDPETRNTPNFLCQSILGEVGKPITAGSDAHFRWEVGRGETLISANEGTKAVRDAIRTGRTRVKKVKASMHSNRTLSYFIKIYRDPSLAKIASGIKILSIFSLKDLRQFLIQLRSVCLKGWKYLMA